MLEIKRIKYVHPSVLKPHIHSAFKKLHARPQLVKRVPQDPHQYMIAEGNCKVHIYHSFFF